MRWAEKQRIAFICDHIAREGWVGRKPIIDTFGVSAAQASIDLRTAQQMHPGLMSYDRSAKRYMVAAVPAPAD